MTSGVRCIMPYKRGPSGRIAFMQLTILAINLEFLVNLWVLVFSGPHHAWRAKLLDYVYDRSKFHRDESSMKVLTLCLLSGSPGATGDESSWDCNLGQLLGDFSASTSCRDPKDRIIAMKGLHTCDTAENKVNDRGMRPLEISYEQNIAEVVRLTKAHLDGARVSWRGGRVEQLLNGLLRRSST